jgi:4-hydroxybenzoate polyprenyltransferase
LVVGGSRRAPKPARPVSKFEARFMVIYLLAAALFVVAVVEVLAWALCSGGYWLPGLFVAANPSSSRFG